MDSIPKNLLKPGMKKITDYAFVQLRYNGLMQLNYKQVHLIQPVWRVYYLWDLAKPKSKRRMQWYATPEAVLASPHTTPDMRRKASAMIEYRKTPGRVWPKKPSRKPEEMPKPGKVDPPKPAPQEDWI